MANKLWTGVAAGAAGTVALNIATYVDMVMRGRPSSSAPSQMVNVLAEKAGIDLPAQGKGNQDAQAQNRESGLGALLGFVNGLGVGALYGLFRSQTKHVSLPLASLGVGALAMAASDIPLIGLRVSDPKSWGVSGWASDAIPHFIYGMTTVLVYEAYTHK